MRFFYIPIIVIINFLLQTTLFNFLRIGGVAPNTALIIIVTIALLKGKKTGAILGLSVGLLQDLMFNDVIGVYTLIYFLIGYGVGLVDNKVYKENSFIALIFTGGATILFYLLFNFLMYFLAVDVSFKAMFKNIIFIELIYNLVLSIPIYKIVTRLFRSPRLSFRK